METWLIIVASIYIMIGVGAAGAIMEVLTEFADTPRWHTWTIGLVVSVIGGVFWPLIVGYNLFRKP